MWLRVCLPVPVLLALCAAPRTAGACTDAAVCVADPVLPASGRLPRAGVVFVPSCGLDVTHGQARSGTSAIDLATAQHLSLVEAPLPQIGPLIELDLFDRDATTPFRTLQLETSSVADEVPPPAPTSIRAIASYETRNQGCGIDRTGFWVQVVGAVPARETPTAALLYEVFGAERTLVAAGIDALGGPEIAFELPVGDGEHCYAMELIDLGGNRSGPSPESCVTISATDAGAADAGPPLDGSVSPDAGAALEVEGCACACAPLADFPATPSALALLLGVATLGARRRRR